MPVHVLGVRHHGPGSARSVAAALDEVHPDAVVIEGAPELDEIAALATDPGMRPPVAGLVYDRDSPRRAGFYPFAVFSPEWVALRWALEHGIPVRFADLPAVHALALRAADEDTEDTEDTKDEQEGDNDGADAAAPPRAEAALATDSDERQDPIALLARAAGYADPERWWEDSVEHRSDSATDRFEHILAAMRQVRAARPQLDDAGNQRREAAMRKVIREVAAAHGTVVVVCGAFHAPALEPAAFPSRAADARLLTGLPRVKIGVTWAPWTNDRLSLASGYGAGVTAPGWYHHLYTAETADSTDLLSGWLVKVSRALRGQQLEAAPATAVEAVRLAGALAAVRGRPAAGLDELDDAALAVLCEGSEERLGLVRRELFVGDVLGTVPEHTPLVPLAADLAKWQRSLRLVQSSASSVVQLDLRQPPQLARSVFFHRLRLLDIDWAVPTQTGRTTGTFKEGWELAWRPELSVDVIEASRYGTTIASASSARVSEAAASATLPELSALVEQSLLADLPTALSTVVARLGEQTAHSHDIRELLGTVEPLARTVRYGDVRGLDTAALLELVQVLVARVSVGLRAGSQSLDDDLAAATRAALESAHRGIVLLDDEQLRGPWFAALAGLGDEVHGGLCGRVDRILLDAGLIDRAEAAGRMSRRLSAAVAGPQSAAWLDAFLTGEAVLLLHDAALLGILDEWVGGVPEPVFEDLLPLLRRTFSGFSGPERRQLGNHLAHTSVVGRHGIPADGEPADPADLARALPAIAATARLLGLEVRR